MKMKIERSAEATINKLLKLYQVVTVVGPRQSGKTTLARHLRPKLPYVNLEDLRHREFAQQDVVAFIEQFPTGAVIDEIQRVPELTSQIQVIVDEKKKNGMFLLTGSHQFEVMERISQSLAGRTAVFKLLPLSFSESRSSLKKNTKSDEILFQGGYPRVVAEKLNPTFYYQDYVATYLERDLRQLSEIRNLGTFQRFLKLCASRIGQILDLQDLGDSVGVSQTTAKTWMNLLQASYILFLLPPYFANISKRLAKRPKLYFYDVGLAAFLLDMTEISHLRTHPLRGNLFENFVVLDVIKKKFNAHLPLNCYFYRDKEKNEVDLILKEGARIQAVEIKSGQTVNPDYFKGLRALARTKLPLISPSYVVYDGNQTQKRSEATVIGMLDFLSSK